MQLLHLISTLAWALTVAAGTFDVAKLTELTFGLQDYVIDIHGANLLAVLVPHRDHYTLLVLTLTDEKHNCEICKDLKVMLRNVANAWFRDYTLSNYLFFAEVDIIDRSNLEVFDFLRLGSVPQIWLIPPSSITSRHKSDREPKYDDNGDEVYDNFDILLEPHAQFDMPTASFDTQQLELADWLAKAISKRILLRQQNPLGRFAMTFGVTFGAILLIRKKGPSAITGTVTKAKVYRVVVLLALLAILGGYSFTTIQGAPLVAKGANDTVIYISGGQSYQFGAEIPIVGAVYLLLGSTLVALVRVGEKGSPVSGLSPAKRAAIVLLLTALLYLAYSALTTLFLIKNEWYPYPFTKLW